MSVRFHRQRQQLCLLSIIVKYFILSTSGLDETVEKENEELEKLKKDIELQKSLKNEVTF